MWRDSILLTLLAAVVSLGLQPATASAAVPISLTVTLTLQIDGERIRAEIAVVNSGGAPAIGLEAVLKLPDENLPSAAAHPLLAPGERHLFTMASDLPHTLRGRYPALAEVTFKSGAGDVYSALACTTFDIDHLPESVLEARIAAVRPGPHSSLPVRLTSSSQDPLQIAIDLKGPKQLHLTLPTKTVVLPPGAHQEVLFDVSNSVAGAGAAPPIFGILEYDHSGRHHTTVAAGRFRVSQTPHWYARTRRLWLAGLVPLGCAWLLIGWRHRRRNSGPGPA